MKKKILIIMMGLLLIGVNLYAAGDLIVLGKVGVGTTTPGQKLEVNGGIVKTFGGYGTQGFVSDLDMGGQDDPAATSLVSGVERATFLFSVCEGCNYGRHSFAIQARPRSNVLLGQTAIEDTVFEITEYGTTSIGKYEPNAMLEVSASGGTADLFYLNSDDANTGDLFIVKNSGNVGIGTAAPTEKLEVEGNVEAWGYITGDITFQKDGKKLWRMFEDEEGLYLESLKTGKVYRFVLQEIKKK